MLMRGFTVLLNYSLKVFFYNYLLLGISFAALRGLKVASDCALGAIVDVL